MNTETREAPADLAEATPIAALPVAVENRPTPGPVMVVGKPTPMDMLASAIDRGMSIETIEKLMGLEERWRANNARESFDRDLANFKAEAVVVVKRRTVDFQPQGKGRVHYKHANLFDVIEAISPALSKWGFSWNWSVRQEKDWITVTCKLRHRDGHYEEATMGGPADTSGSKNPIQAIASATSYLQRHTLKAVTGVAEADEGADDGRGAGHSLPQEVQDLIARAKTFKQDDQARKFWIDNRAATGEPGTPAYDAFKKAVETHRETLKARKA